MYFRHIFISFIKQFSIGKDCISVFVTIFFFWHKEAFFLGPNQSLHLCKPNVLQVIFYEIYELFLHSNQNVALFFIYVGYINADLWLFSELFKFGPQTRLSALKFQKKMFAVLPLFWIFERKQQFFNLDHYWLWADFGISVNNFQIRITVLDYTLTGA